ncbi:MAG: biotin-dependent carboxyltransferase family protein [Magnetospirillum sp.]|nr:biotin-dependent carboxyltransferase family protein [Magnetospirillum sp.]
MAALHVLRPGLFTTIQDMGRTGYGHLGVPVAGALNPVGLRLANALVGNEAGEGGLEISYLCPTLRIEGGTLRIGLMGAVTARLDRAGESRVLQSGRSHLLFPGDVLDLGAVSGASVAYLAVEGGFDLAPVLGSLSSYGRAAIGPLGGRALVAGDLLPVRRLQAAERAERAYVVPFDYGMGPLRVVMGPQADRFSAAAVETFLSSPYRVGRDADRMGLRLEGPALDQPNGAGIVSDGLVSGCIQVPGNGLPILLLADHQTVGGYAKIATVISADLPRAALAVPGSALRFHAVSMDEAEAARRDLEGRIAIAIGGLAELSGALNLAALYSANLVSGMVCGGEEDS